MGTLYLICEGICLQIKGKGDTNMHNIHILNTRLSGYDILNSAGIHCSQAAVAADVEGCPHGIAMEGNVSQVYIEHNAFAYNWDKPIYVYSWMHDKAADQAVVPEPTNITISYNHIRNSYYALLAGVSNDVPIANLPTTYAQVSHITLYGSWFDQIERRSARASEYTEIDEFNNLVADYGGMTACNGGNYGFGPSAVQSGQMLLTNNVYEAWPNPQSCKEALQVDEGPDPLGPGLLTDTGSLLLNGATATLTPGDVLDQPPYDRALIAATAVEADVRTNAGPE